MEIATWNQSEILICITITSGVLFCMYFQLLQTWMLSIYLPLIIGSEVPPEEPLWECFLLLLDILQITTAHILSCGLAAYLAVLIHDHHSMFRHLLPYCFHYTENALYGAFSLPNPQVSALLLSFFCCKMLGFLVHQNFCGSTQSDST